MSSIKRRLGTLAVAAGAAGASLTGIAGAGTAAHADVLPPHQVTPTITLRASSNYTWDGGPYGGTKTFYLGTWTMVANMQYEWDRAWCFGGYPGGNVESILVKLVASTDSSNNLTTHQTTTAIYGPKACSGTGYSDSGEASGQAYDSTGALYADVELGGDTGWHYDASTGVEVSGAGDADVQVQ